MATGSHTINVSVKDTTGNTGTGSGSFTVGDNSAPSVVNFQPTGTIYVGSSTVSADYSDADTSINAATATLTVSGASVSGCAADATHISCTASGMAAGTHTINVSVKDTAGNSGSGSASFIVADNVAPVISNVQPAGTIFTTSATISADYSDPLPSSVIDPSSAMIHVDGGMLFTGCVATETHASCPISGLTPGMHDVEIFINDYAGNMGYVATSFIVVADTTAPSVTYGGPTGVISASNPTITGSASDAAPSSGIAAATLSLNSGASITCAVNGTGNVSCPTFGLADGVYNAVITVTDNTGNAGHASGSFTVTTCSGVKPGLSLEAPRPFWASYADYTASRLSITWTVRNTGADNALNVKMISSSPAPGVILLAAMPASIGSINAGASGSVVLQYRVPQGMRGFRVINAASAEDSCGNMFLYP